MDTEKLRDLGFLLIAITGDPTNAFTLDNRLIQDVGFHSLIQTFQRLYVTKVLKDCTPIAQKIPETVHKTIREGIQNSQVGAQRQEP